MLGFHFSSSERKAARYTGTDAA